MYTKKHISVTLSVAKSLLFLLPILLSSCTERYDFKLQETASKPVIIGYVCTEKGQYAIDITRTRGYFDTGSMRDVPPAKVWINGEELTPDK